MFAYMSLHTHTHTHTHIHIVPNQGLNPHPALEAQSPNSLDHQGILKVLLLPIF